MLDTRFRSSASERRPHPGWEGHNGSDSTPSCEASQNSSNRLYANTQQPLLKTCDVPTCSIKTIADNPPLQQEIVAETYTASQRPHLYHPPPALPGPSGPRRSPLDRGAGQQLAVLHQRRTAGACRPHPGHYRLCRDSQVEPPARSEARLVPGRRPLPRHRHDHLLPILESVCVPAGRRL
ncbi:hypothetical protein VTI74DRAFT_10422 [Chaetomium olivicolor]